MSSARLSEDLGRILKFAIGTKTTRLNESLSTTYSKHILDPNRMYISIGGRYYMIIIKLIHLKIIPSSHHAKKTCYAKCLICYSDEERG